MNLMKATDMPKAFTNLFNLYAHELSKYNPWIGTQINEEGDYLTEAIHDYIYNSEHESYCIVEKNKPIGFVVFSYEDNKEEDICYIAEIFLLNTSRGKGICETICKDFWMKNKGTCILHVLKENQVAVTYWEKLISKSGYTYDKDEHDEQMLMYEIHLGNEQ